MADTLSLAGARSARLSRTPTGALELVGRSAILARLQEFVQRAAALDGGVLLVAERGTDVESIARELHLRGRPASAPFVGVECSADGLDAALFGARSHPASDLESASSDSLLAAARGGTLFLRDVGELPAAVQARLARVARDGEVRIDGEPVATSLRLIASSPSGIDADMQEQRFRADLYRRLSASRIDVPALRDRPDDVPAMAARVIEDLCAQHGLAPRTFTPPALALLGALPWPGNVAELRDVVERIVSATDAETLHVEHLLPALPLERAPLPFVPAGTLREARVRFERDYIAAVLQHHGWRMADAATTLGIQRPNLYRKARQLGIPLARVTE
jgi:two-component system nitrogen regulation response regulator NtrX